ncbi:MAG: ATP-binding protein [Magnetococcus sp. WYHC-3]
MRLFLKLFFSFWATVLVSALAVAWLGQQLHDDMERHLQQHMGELAQERLELADLLGNQGQEALRKRLQVHPHRNFHMVFDEQNRELLQRPPPPHLLSMLEEMRVWEVNASLPTMVKGGTPPFVPLAVHAGRWFHLAIVPPHSLGMLVTDQPLLPLAVVVISGLVVLALAGHFTRPLRHLRQVALRLGSGEFGARATLRRPLLPDELDGLLGDFNLMAQRLDHLFHAQQRLLRDVSHELRSPLARMRVAIGLMEQANAMVQAPIQRLTLELERLDDLIGQIIRISRPDPSTVPESWLDLGELLRTVADDARYESEGRDCRMELFLAEALVVQADAPRLRSALENVVRNALRYSPAHGTVTVTMTREGNNAVLVVADQGVGVPEEHLARIFDPFYRVSESRERESGGFGLGLAIASRAIREHGGEIIARNGKSAGLDVVITLPLSQESEHQGPADCDLTVFPA